MLLPAKRVNGAALANAGAAKIAATASVFSFMIGI
jgi:hypothetical protein